MLTNWKRWSRSETLDEMPSSKTLDEFPWPAKPKVSGQQYFEPQIFSEDTVTKT